MALTGAPQLDVAAVKKEFPILDRVVNGRRLVFLDSAASSQKPRAVIDAMTHYYETTHANVHRGVYSLAEEATAAYEKARTDTARFVGAKGPSEIVFAKNVTEVLNLIAHSWGRQNLHEGDAILLTVAEHHANLVPWLQLAEERGIELRYLDIDDDYQIDMSDLDRLIDGVKLVSITAASNVLGTLPPIRTISDAAHAAGALVCVDGAQFSPHLRTDVSELGCDFYGFTAHKMLGPTGIGVMWARDELLESMDPFLGGGEMIADVRLDGWTAREHPYKFEAGTPPIAEAIGLGAAIEMLDRLDFDAIREHEVSLTAYALRHLNEQLGERITIFGPAEPSQRMGVISFELADVHPHDVSQVLDREGVAVRAGHHCAKPLMRRLGVNATVRASFYVYNDEDDVDALADALESASDFFAL